MVVADRQDLGLHRGHPQGEGAGVMLEKEVAKNRSTEPKSARWIMYGWWRPLSAPTYSMSKRCGIWKSTWIVETCQRRPMASRTCTSILGA